jgi:hypothetical protein
LGLAELHQNSADSPFLYLPNFKTYQKPKITAVVLSFMLHNTSVALVLSLDRHQLKTGYMSAWVTGRRNFS